MESTDLQCVLKEISEWEQAKGAKRRRFLADLLEDKDLHDEFYVRLPDAGVFSARPYRARLGPWPCPYPLYGAAPPLLRAPTSEHIIAAEALSL